MKVKTKLALIILSLVAIMLSFNSCKYEIVESDTDKPSKVSLNSAISKVEEACGFNNPEVDFLAESNNNYLLDIVDKGMVTFYKVNKYSGKINSKTIPLNETDELQKYKLKEKEFIDKEGRYRYTGYYATPERAVNVLSEYLKNHPYQEGTVGNPIVECSNEDKYLISVAHYLRKDYSMNMAFTVNKRTEEVNFITNFQDDWAAEANNHPGFNEFK